jgi:hypothetical protein
VIGDWYERWRPIWLAFFIVCSILTMLVRLARGSDYVVTRSVQIDSERPIARLILEMGTGVLDGRDGTGSLGSLVEAGEAEIETRLWVDGRQQAGRTSFLAAWRLIGFVLWDADGTVERVTTLEYRGRRVRIVDGASDGRVWVRVTIGPPLGDPRVRQARLTLIAEENEHGNVGPLGSRGTNVAGLSAHGRTGIELACSAVLDLPADSRRERVHSRRQRWGCDSPALSERIANREAGPELSSRVNGLADTGRRAVLAGRGQIDAVVEKFIREVIDR